jgi:hypothetical protein
MAGDEKVLRICVDLNVWVRHVLSVGRGRTDTASGVIVRSVQAGRAALGPLQLIVSHTMLSRLADVLVRKGVEPGDADAYVTGIANFARRGPALEPPHVVLGGGIEPTAESRQRCYDPYDPKVVPPRIDDEDGRVLDTVVAGRAHVLATMNFADFRGDHDEIVEDGFIHVRATADHRFLIMHADRVAQWLRTGTFPSPKKIPDIDPLKGFP